MERPHCRHSNRWLPLTILFAVAIFDGSYLRLVIKVSHGARTHCLAFRCYHHNSASNYQTPFTQWKRNKWNASVSMHVYCMMQLSNYQVCLENLLLRCHNQRNSTPRLISFPWERLLPFQWISLLSKHRSSTRPMPVRDTRPAPTSGYQSPQSLEIYSGLVSWKETCHIANNNGKTAWRENNRKLCSGLIMIRKY